MLLTFGPEDDGWLLVQEKDGGKIGYIPGNYVEVTPSIPSQPSANYDYSPARIWMILVPLPPPLLQPPVLSFPILLPAQHVRSAYTSILQNSFAPLPPRPRQTPSRLGQSQRSIRKARRRRVLSASATVPYSLLAKPTRCVFEQALSASCARYGIDVGPGCQTPVQKWQIGDIISADIDKSKHILIEVGGTAATNLHFHAGNKDTAEEILTKLESSRSLARESTDSAAALGAEAERQTQPEAEPSSSPAPVQHTLPPPLRTDGAHSPSKSVHFSEASPAIIPRSPSPPGQEEEQAQHEDAEGLEAFALYDFQAQGDDELTVAEGDALWIIEKDGDEWWKCRNVKGDEGVVPASYVEVRSLTS